MRTHAIRAALPAAALLLSACLAGCYSTSGGIMSRTGGGFTYESTEARPTTITLVNACERTQEHPNGTPFFIMEIPPGKQLTFNFEETGGDDPVERPARMMYALWEAGTGTGSLSSVLSCPPSACRRIDVTYRPAPEKRRPDESYRMAVYPHETPSAVAQPRAPRQERTDSPNQ